MDTSEKHHRHHHNRFTKTLTRLVNQPKFELHLRVFDLNNVPLVSGHSFIKWHIANSIHAEHRGRSPRCPILNHRVDYGYTKVVPSIRIPIDRNSALSECHIELEVLQEFSVPSATVRDERVPLGVVRLNLSEFVEESDAITSRKRSASLGAMGSPPIPRVHGGDEVAEDGIVRRYLMQESKVNSTLQIGILMVQIDGERNYAAPPLKSAPVFGGIAGFMAGEQVEQDDTAGQIPNIHKARDAAELQDLYRSALTAVWCAQPEEHPASAVVEDIFSGGNGWAISSARSRRAKSSGSAHYHDDGDESSGSISGDEGYGGTLRPSDFKRAQRRVARKLASERTLRAEGKKGGGDGGARSRSGSLASLAPTLGSSEREREAGLERARVREVSEAEARDDMVAWRLSGRV